MKTSDKSPQKGSIINYLELLESKEQIKILYAAESGSRAWGFASPDSDYDVRFIYAHQKHHYLSFNVERKKSHMECSISADDWDVKGWDIRKALHLFTKSNGNLLEWMHSPIVYKAPVGTIQDLRTLAKAHFDPVALCYHYYRLGINQARRYILNRIHGDDVILKKYIYVIRALVACQWVFHQEHLPPVDFLTLINATAEFDDLVKSITPATVELIKAKQEGRELGTGYRIPELDNFIEIVNDKHDNGFSGFDRGDLRLGKWDEELNRIFRRSIIWGRIPNNEFMEPRLPPYKQEIKT